MLVLSRKEGEKLVIGDNITLVVSKIAGNRVTVGIEAPADVKIFRGELADTVDRIHRRHRRGSRPLPQRIDHAE